MGFFGGLIGKGLGALGELALGKTKGINGSDLGQNIGSRLIPFAKGGRVLRAPTAMKTGGLVKKRRGKKRGKCKCKK